MSSYKKHVLFSIIMTLPFFCDVFYLLLAVLGASILDMDHHIKRKNLMIIIFFGVLLSLVSYILKLPFFVAIFVIIPALLLYISKHRGFMHSLIGIFIVAVFLAFFVLGLNVLIESYKINNYVSLVMILIILGIMILNKKIIPVFCLLTSIGIFITPFPKFHLYYIFIAIFLGCLSHIILDLFTSRGIELFSPISSQRCRRGCGTVLLVLWGFFLSVSFLRHCSFIFNQ